MLLEARPAAPTSAMTHTAGIRLARPERRRILIEIKRRALLAVEAGEVLHATGAEAAADMNRVKSPETYLGYERAENFVSPGGAVRDMRHTYQASVDELNALNLNAWGLTGDWTIANERASLDASGGGIVYRFHARDLHLVLGPGSDGKPVRFRVTIDGKPPGADHGMDTDTEGNGTVTGERLYQLIRQKGDIADHTFAIEFLDPGVRAYAFTFG